MTELKLMIIFLLLFVLGYILMCYYILKRDREKGYIK